MKTPQQVNVVPNRVGSAAFHLVSPSPHILSRYTDADSSFPADRSLCIALYSPLLSFCGLSQRDCPKILQPHRLSRSLSTPSVVGYPKGQRSARSGAISVRFMILNPFDQGFSLEGNDNIWIGLFPLCERLRWCHKVFAGEKVLFVAAAPLRIAGTGLVRGVFGNPFSVTAFVKRDQRFCCPGTVVGLSMVRLRLDEPAHPVLG